MKTKTPRKRGPEKAKTQITIRIDTELMNEVNAQVEEDGIRITDRVERGLILELTEARHQLPAWTKQIRFVLANVTKEQERLIRGLAIAMAEPHLDSYAPSPLEEKFWEWVCWFLESRNKSANAVACLEYYSHYGKSAQEIAG